MALNITIFKGHGEGEIGGLARITVNGEPVLTTTQLTKFYDCKQNRLTDNFRENKEHFVEGKHYFKLTGEDLKNFKSQLGNSELAESQTGYSELPYVGKAATHLMLWTKRGVARHAKMLNTHTAWEVFELLEDNYFSDKKFTEKTPKTSSKDALTDKEKIKFLLQAAKITKDATRRENLIAIAEKIIVG